jgi:hypothetical protein
LFDIRRRSFCLPVATVGRKGKAAPLLFLTKETDWEEIRELVTKSYRILAPKKLRAQLDNPYVTPNTE